MKRLQALLFIICTCAIGGFAQERYSWKRLAGNATASLAINAAVTYSLKPLVSAVRPDGSDNRSFPSGHTSFAFTGATVLYKETRDISPWIGFAGYAAATGVAIERVKSGRHHWADVLGGAGVGVLSAELGYWFCRKTMRKNRKYEVALQPGGLQLVVCL